jgi:transposase
MLEQVLAVIHVPRHGRGRPRTRPDAVIADKAYSSGTIRRQLRSRSIAAVIPEKSDTIAARKRRGSRGGRPPKLDVDLYKERNVVERSFARAKQWRALATRYDKHAITYRAAVTLFAILTWVRLLGDTP